ncbi:MAG: TIR domain-containing protein, partial [Acutalibacteraceae bacterium]
MAENFDVFISYRRSDGTALAVNVRDGLEKRGFRVFLDERDLEGGEDFDEQLEKNIIAAPNYILIATPDVFKFREKKDWVLKEIEIALDAFDKDKENRKIYPIFPLGSKMPEEDQLPESIRKLHVKNGLELKTAELTDGNILYIVRTITKINRRNLWNAGQRYLEQIKSAGARFNSLHIDERIMPLAVQNTPKDEENFPIRVQSREGDEAVRLSDALEANSGHVYLIGEGGIGKTTALISIMEQAYEKSYYTSSAKIPLFLELNRAPEYSTWYQGDEKLESVFIRLELSRILRNADRISNVPKDCIYSLDKEFSKKTDSPEYLLLLDGLNEVSADQVEDKNGNKKFIRTLIIDEIKHLLTDCPNVRVILTSRTDETEINCEEHNIQKLHLTGVDDETIRAYLDSNGKSAEIIDNALNNENLLGCLRIPLFLTIYAKLSETKGITSRGEILRQFFHERSKNLYSQQSRIKDFHNDTGEKQLLFILDFLLPAIGGSMERNGEFYLSAERIAKIIGPVLTGRSDSEGENAEEPTQSQGFFKRLFGKKDTSDNRRNKRTSPDPTAIIGEYGKQFFNQYSHYRVKTSNVAKEILDSGETIVDVAEFVIHCCVSVLGILQETSGKYGFIHHHIRDYFAAVCDINTLGLAVYINNENPKLAFNCLAQFIENANHREKSVFIGEYLGEHHNKPYLKGEKWQYAVPTKPCDRNLLKRALGILRGRFSGEAQYGCYNLIEPIKLVREDLSGADLSNLDLQLVTLNGVRLGSTETGGANFQGAKLSMENLLCQRHSGSVNCVAYSPDGKTFISGSDDNTIKEWNIATGQCIRTY